MVEECSSVENFLYNNHCCINPENFDSVLFNRKMWMDDHQRLINELRSAINTHLPDEDLHVLVDGVMLNYSDLYRLKGLGVKSDVCSIFMYEVICHSRCAEATKQRLIS